MESNPANFEQHHIRRLYDEETETLLRLIQSIPSPKAEPIKLWLAKVGYERIQEMSNPSQPLDRARETWKQHGYSEKGYYFDAKQRRFIWFFFRPPLTTYQLHTHYN